MPEADDEISFRLRFGSGGTEGQGWFILPLTVGNRYTLEMVPNPMAPRSSISPRAFEELKQRTLAFEIHELKTRAKSCVLRNVSVEGYTLPDLEVRIRPQLSFLRADGYLGQDFFFRNFSSIQFDVDSRTMRLRRRREP